MNAYNSGYLRHEINKLPLTKRTLFNQLSDAGMWDNMALLAVSNHPEHIVQEILDKIEGQEVEPLEIGDMIIKASNKERILADIEASEAKEEESEESEPEEDEYDPDEPLTDENCPF